MLTERVRSGSELPRVDDRVGSFGRSGGRVGLEDGVDEGDRS